MATILSTETHTVPTANYRSSVASTSNASVRRSWRLTNPLKKSKKRRNSPAPADLQSPNKTSSVEREERWWQIHWGLGMWNDFKRRYPFYISDWTDAWDYRVVPATVYMYFANVLPALAFSLDMFEKTNNSYGVNEVLLSSVLGAVVFSFLAAQPLVIVGVTGPITVFSYTVYDIVVPKGINFFSFMCLIGLWSLAMHWFLAITNSCNGLKYVTRFSCDTFGFYVAFIYLQKGIQVLTRQWQVSDTSAYLSIMVSLLVLMVAYACGVIGGSSLFHRMLRKFVEDYGTPLTIIFFTGFVHIGKMEHINVTTLPTSKAFFPTKDRSWFVNPGIESSVGDVFTALPFGILLTILFWFDHNVSSLIAQGTEFPLEKPAGFHWDIFLLGLTTGIAGLLGIPFPNGLIPQAPFHTNALCVTRQVVKAPFEKRNDDSDDTVTGLSAPQSTRPVRVVDHIVEQRLSNLAQGLLTLGTMSGPLLIVIHLIPQAVLAGLFFVMGVQALEGNGITLKLLYLLRDNTLYPSAATDENAALRALPRQHMIWLFVALELLGFAATFAISQTIAAIGFPIIILLLIPFRAFLMPRWFRPAELRALDAPTASPFTMESVGGAFDASPAGPSDPSASHDNDTDADDALSAAEEGRSTRRRRGSTRRSMHSQRSSGARRGSSAAGAGPGLELEEIEIPEEREEEAVADDEDEHDGYEARAYSPVAARLRRTSSRKARPGAEIWGRLGSGGGGGGSPVAVRTGGGRASGSGSGSPVARRDGIRISGEEGAVVERGAVDFGGRSRSRSKVTRMGSHEF